MAWLPADDGTTAFRLQPWPQEAGSMAARSGAAVFSMRERDGDPLADEEIVRVSSASCRRGKFRIGWS
ncbi:MAG: hypothetical protein PGN34_11670 [Methylobacterium frigidaeris]